MKHLSTFNLYKLNEDLGQTPQNDWLKSLLKEIAPSDKKGVGYFTTESKKHMNRNYFIIFVEQEVQIFVDKKPTEKMSLYDYVVGVTASHPHIEDVTYTLKDGIPVDIKIYEETI